jgi:hypothetical protein
VAVEISSGTGYFVTRDLFTNAIAIKHLIEKFRTLLPEFFQENIPLNESLPPHL